MDEKRITIRIPDSLWDALSALKKKGDIKSIQDAAIRGLEKVVKEAEETSLAEVEDPTKLEYYGFKEVKKGDPVQIVNLGNNEWQLTLFPSKQEKILSYRSGRLELKC